MAAARRRTSAPRRPSIRARSPRRARTSPTSRRPARPPARTDPRPPEPAWAATLTRVELANPALDGEQDAPVAALPTADRAGGHQLEAPHGQHDPRSRRGGV